MIIIYWIFKYGFIFCLFVLIAILLAILGVFKVMLDDKLDDLRDKWGR